MQYIPDNIEPYNQTVIDMSEDEWQRELSRLMSEPLKLIGGRLFRLDLIQTEKAKYLLSTMHHVCFDQTASNVLFKYIEAAYNDLDVTPEGYNAIDAARDEAEKRVGFSFADLNQICPMNDKPLFAYHGMIKTTSTFCGLPRDEKILDSDATGNQLGVELLGEPSGMKLHIEYNAGKYSRSFIENFARTYENVLNQLMSREYIRDIEPATGEQLAVLDGFNDTYNPYDDTQTIVSLFRKAARENSDRPAVIFKYIKLTYKELDDVTERIAGYIANKGLGVGDVVSILILH